MEDSKNWKKEYLVTYSIYKPFTSKEIKEENIRNLHNKEEFLNQWCNKEKELYRFSAKNNKHAEKIILIHKSGLEYRGEKRRAIVTIDEVLRIRPIKDKLNLEEELEDYGKGAAP